MNGVAEQSWTRARSTLRPPSAASPNALNASGSRLLFGLEPSTSVCFALNVAIGLELGNAFRAGASAALICPPLAPSLRKAWFRLDQRPSFLPRSEVEASLSLRTRPRILAASEALVEHS